MSCLRKRQWGWREKSLLSWKEFKKNACDVKRRKFQLKRFFWYLNLRKPKFINQQIILYFKKKQKENPQPLCTSSLLESLCFSWDSPSPWVWLFNSKRMNNSVPLNSLKKKAISMVIMSFLASMNKKSTQW